MDYLRVWEESRKAIKEGVISADPILRFSVYRGYESTWVYQETLSLKEVGLDELAGVDAVVVKFEFWPDTLSEELRPSEPLSSLLKVAGAQDFSLEVNDANTGENVLFSIEI